MKKSPRRTQRRIQRRRSGFLLEPLETRTLLSSSIPLNSVGWTPLGPAPTISGNQQNSGHIPAIAADPTDPSIIYIGGNTGGVWKTSDGGGTWTPLTDDQPNLVITALAIARTNPNILYAATGSAIINAGGCTTVTRRTSTATGVLKSADAGLTWNLVGTASLGDEDGVQLVIDPTNPNTVYLATRNANAGVWKSTDGGGTWSNTTASLSSIASDAQFTDLAINPVNPQILYAAVGCDASGGIYKTTNGGGSWTRLAGGMAIGDIVGNTKIAIAPSDPQTAYVSISGSGTAGSAPEGELYKLLKTTNGGTNWVIIANVPNYMGGQGFYDSTLAVDPRDSQIVYAGGQADANSIIRTIDGGLNWQDLSVGDNGVSPHVDHHGIGFDANGKLLDGNDGGLWRLDNPTAGSVSWSDLNGNLQITQYVGIALHPTNSNIVYAGAQDNGTQKFTGSRVWTEIVGGDGGRAHLDPSNPNTVYHTFFYGGFDGFLERSDDAGATFSPKTLGIDTFDPGNFYVPYVVDPARSSRLLLGTNRVYETTDRADTWAAISDPGQGGWTEFSPIDSVATSATAVDTIYASAGGHIFVTTNHGTAWQERDITGFIGTVDDLIVDPTSSNIAYAVGGNALKGIGHVYRTTDAGVNWTDISSNLPDQEVFSIILDPNAAGQSDDVLYLGNETGVYASNSLGVTWTRLGTGLPNVLVRDVEIAKSLNILAAGTYGRGLWEILLSPSQFDSNPPTATLNAPDITTFGASTYTFTVTYTDETAVDVSTLDNSDIRVTGPNAYSQTATFLGVDINSAGSPRVATYRITAPGIWDPTDNGAYTVSILGSQVSDVGAHFIAAGALGTFNVAIPAVPEISVSLNSTDIADGQSTAIAFPPAIHNQSATTLTFTVLNSGTQALTLGAVSLPAGFTLVEGLSASLAAGTSDTFTVGLTTGTAGTFTGQITFSNNDSNENPFSFPISGLVANGPEIDITDNSGDPADKSLTLPSTRIGLTSAPLTFTLANTGDFPLFISNLDKAGTHKLEFVLGVKTNTGAAVTGTSFTIPAGVSYTIDVTFSPLSEGAKSATITFNTNDFTDSESAITLNIDGTATLLPVSSSDISVVEDNRSGVAVFTISAPVPSAQAITFDYATADGTALAGQDYTAASGSATIPAGQTSTTISIPINPDSIDEADETFFLNLSNPTNATISTPQVQGTILDDDLPTLNVGDVTVVEGNSGTSDAVFTASLLRPGDQDITFFYTTSGGTATAGVDYTASSGTGMIPAGQTSVTFAVPVIGDTTFEPDKTFFVRISSTVNASIGDRDGMATIQNDDPAPDVTAPVASVASAKAPKANAADYSFTIVYTDAGGIDPASIGTGDVRVTGPRNFKQNGKVKQMTVASDGKTATVIYTISAPGGHWDIGDNGTYTILMQANQVSDLAGNFVAAGTLGTFQANLRRTRIDSAGGEASVVQPLAKLGLSSPSNGLFSSGLFNGGQRIRWDGPDLFA
jgi:photosystem II stability/assembly factor-like uncharacterized protein